MPNYPRPKGATPLLASLVPAFAQCTSANRMHGPPLAFSSCNPPALRSGQLTVGTPDANGQTANSAGMVRYDAIVGDPGTPADEADVALRVNITDVRRQSDLADYTGQLQASAALRITDRDNAGSGRLTGRAPPRTARSRGRFRARPRRTRRSGRRAR